MIKKIIVLVCMVICISITACSSTGSDKILEEVFKGYNACIKEYVESSEYDISDKVRYTLAYINDDDIPELVLSEGDSHASGVRVYFYDSDQKKVIDNGERYGNNGGFSYFEKKNLIYDYYFGNGGYGNVCFCSIGSETDFKVTRSKWFTSWVDEEGGSHYAIDFEEVDEEVYEKTYAAEAPEFVEDEIKILEREDMKGDYQTCMGENSIDFLYMVINRNEFK